MPDPITLRLAIVQITDTEHLVIREAQPGQSLPDDKHTWLYATLKHMYDDDATVFADAWVTWECWLYIGLDALRENLRDEIRVARRRQLYAIKKFPASKLIEWRAATFILDDDDRTRT